MTKKRIVISESMGKKQTLAGLVYMEQVVYKTENGVKADGKPSYHSETRHEVKKLQVRPVVEKPK